MYSHDGTWEFMKIAIVIVAIGLFLWWLESRFGANIALIAVVISAGTVFFVGGAILSSYIQRNTLDGVSKFAAKDAMVDRYRMQSLREMSKGESWKIKAESQKQLLDYKQELKNQNRQLPVQRVDENETFWTTNETVDLEDWS